MDYEELESKKNFLLVQKDTYTISEITTIIQNLLENSLDEFSVKGEISNFHTAASGHVYFSLKDEKASISVALFRSTLMKIKNLEAKNGIEVVVRGRLSVYPPRGSYQIIAKSMEALGAGSLQAQFENLKKKLYKEGLFEEERKRKLPSMPRKIAVITSPTSAAIQDVLTVLKRRHAATEVLVIPSLVQGELADLEIIRALSMANDPRINAELILLTRGGGSLEDLWCFNSESLARAIFHSRLPVVSAVGHEVDFTIADFVADFRAPTPSAAAELIVKERSILMEKTKELKSHLIRVFLNYIKNKMMELDILTVKLKNPRDKIIELQIRFAEEAERLNRAAKAFIAKLQKEDYSSELNRSILIILERHKDKLKLILEGLDKLSPLKVLSRGYSLVYSETGKIIKSSKACSLGEEIKVRTHKGEFYADVSKV